MAHGKALPAEVVEQVVANTDGVPLFVEELAKMVLESGLLREVEGGYELTGTLPSLAIPATLHDSLMARLDRLATVKTLAQLGATIGRTFAHELLQAVAPLDEATLQHGLRQLVEAELVYQHGMAPQATYIFKHALIQDTAYQSLLKSTRQQYHQRIAHVLAAQFPETAGTQPELLAHHYTEAGLHEQAIPCWQHAGQRAVARSAYREAVACYEQALLAFQQLPENIATLQQAFDVRMELTQQLVPLADYGSILTHLRGAEAIAEAQGGRRRLGLVCSHMTDYFRLTDYSEQAVECGERALAFATDLGNSHCGCWPTSGWGKRTTRSGIIAGRSNCSKRKLPYWKASAAGNALGPGAFPPCCRGAIRSPRWSSWVSLWRRSPGEKRPCRSLTRLTPHTVR